MARFLYTPPVARKHKVTIGYTLQATDRLHPSINAIEVYRASQALHIHHGNIILMNKHSKLFVINQ